LPRATKRPLDPAVQKYVRRALTQNPKMKLATLKEVAARMNSKIGAMTTAQFHGTYSLPVMRALRGTSGPKPQNENGHPPATKAKLGRPRKVQEVAREIVETATISELPKVVVERSVSASVVEEMNPRLAALAEAEQLEARLNKVRGVFRAFALEGLKVTTAEETRAYLGSIDKHVVEMLQALDEK
jgi:hypothetical protein